MTRRFLAEARTIARLRCLRDSRPGGGGTIPRSDAASPGAAYYLLSDYETYPSGAGGGEPSNLYTGRFDARWGMMGRVLDQ